MRAPSPALPPPGTAARNAPSPRTPAAAPARTTAHRAPPPRPPPPPPATSTKVRTTAAAWSAKTRAQRTSVPIALPSSARACFFFFLLWCVSLPVHFRVVIYSVGVFKGGGWFLNRRAYI